VRLGVGRGHGALVAEEDVDAVPGEPESGERREHGLRHRAAWQRAGEDAARRDGLASGGGEALGGECHEPVTRLDDDLRLHAPSYGARAAATSTLPGRVCEVGDRCYGPGRRCGKRLPDEMRERAWRARADAAP